MSLVPTTPNGLEGFCVITFPSDFDDDVVLLFPNRLSINEDLSFIESLLSVVVLDVTFVGAAVEVNALLDFGFWFSSSDSRRSPNGSSMSKLKWH